MLVERLTEMSGELCLMSVATYLPKERGELDRSEGDV